MINNLLEGNFRVSEVKIHSHNCTHFQMNILWKGMNPLVPHELNSITAVLYKDGFGFNLPTMVNIALNKANYQWLIFIKSCWLYTFPWLSLSLPLSLFPSIPIIHRSQQVLQMTSSVCWCKILLVGQLWSICM